MAIPDFQTVMLPVLRLASTGDFRTAQAIEALSNEFKLTDEERSELLPSKRQGRMANRVHWAIAYLSKAGLLARQGRGHYAITDTGRTILKSAPERISIKFLGRFEGFTEFRAAKAGGNDELSAIADPAADSRTPEERFEAAHLQIVSNLISQVRERVLSVSPRAFEKLLLVLMEKMNYGAKGSLQHLGRAGDGGFDGVVNEDALGLDVIYLQAKRYAPESAIGVEKIGEFAGAIDDRRATKGVFVTTSYFAQPAKDFAARSTKRIVLIDGQELARLMVEYTVGVRGSPDRTFELKNIANDYFDDLEGS